MSKLNNAALGDLWIPIASLAALGAALGIGCRDLVRFRCITLTAHAVEKRRLRLVCAQDKWHPQQQRAD